MKDNRPIQSRIRPMKIGMLMELPNARLNKGVTPIANPVPIRAQAISNPIARAISLPLNHFTMILETVIPAISTPTPNKAYPNDAITNGYPYSEPKTVTVAPSKLCDIPNHLMKTPISMMLVAIKPVKRTPILSRIIPPKISIRKNTLNQP